MGPSCGPDGRHPILDVLEKQGVFYVPPAAVSAGCPDPPQPGSAFVMRQHQSILSVETHGTGFVDITREVDRVVAEAGIRAGLLTALIRHTSAGLVIQENADPDVLTDLTDRLAVLAPRDPSLYRHGSEGPDDMPAHIRAMLTNVQLSIPVMEGRLALGTWQGIYVAEHRSRGSRRQVALHLMGE